MEARIQGKNGEVTQLLESLRGGGDDAVAKLVSFVYAELRRVASGLVKGEDSGLTLSATDIVHEAYMRLFGPEDLDWEDRRHFFASAAIAMRRVLIDHARRTKAEKRIPKDELVPIELMGGDGPLASSGQDILALDQALDALARADRRQAEIVELRFFAGLTAAEVAELLGISRGTVTREWKVARLWLRREMRA